MSWDRGAVVESLRSKSYRHKLVAEHLKVTIPAQFQAMREDRGWTQRQLADITGLKQSWISHLEDPDNEAFTLDTLKKFGEAFDVALVLRWVPFSQFVDWIANLEMRDLAPPPFDDDIALAEPAPSVIERLTIVSQARTIPNFQQPSPMPGLRLGQSVVRPMDLSSQRTAGGMLANVSS
jgi:transcriptional regulator with XRE-family HTH domain